MSSGDSETAAVLFCLKEKKKQLSHSDTVKLKKETHIFQTAQLISLQTFIIKKSSYIYIFFYLKMMNCISAISPLCLHLLKKTKKKQQDSKWKIFFIQILEFCFKYKFFKILCGFSCGHLNLTYKSYLSPQMLFTQTHTFCQNLIYNPEPCRPLTQTTH